MPESIGHDLRSGLLGSDLALLGPTNHLAAGEHFCRDLAAQIDNAE